MTSHGQAALSHRYAELATQALRFLAETAGPEAVAGLRRAARHATWRSGSPAVAAAGTTWPGGPGRLADGAHRRRLRRLGATGAGRDSAIQLCQGHCPVQDVAHEFPAALRGRGPGVLPPARRARATAGDARRRRARLHHAHPGPPSPRRPTHAPQPLPTPCSPWKDRRMSAPTENTATGRDDPGRGDRLDRELQLRLARPRRRRSDRQARPVRGRRARDLRAQERARVDAQDAPEVAAPVRQEAHAQLGCRPVGHRLRQHQVLRALDREAGGQLGRPARGHPQHVRPPGHPGGREAAPRRRRRGPVRVRGRLPPDPGVARGAGRHLPRHRHRPARAPGDLRAVLRLGHPARATTSSPRSTPPCGRAARSSTSRRACTSRSRCRPTSGSTPRTWASSSGR